MRPLVGLGWIALLLLAWVVARVPIALANFEALAGGPSSAIGDVTDAPSAHPPVDDRRRAPMVPQLASPLAPPKPARAAPASLSLAQATSLPTTSPVTAASAAQSPPARQIDRPFERAEGEEPRSEPSAASVAFAHAERAYAHLGEGERRKAATAFERALSASPDHAGAALWRRELRGLKRRLHADAYAAWRDGGAPRLQGETPVFGGTQFGAQMRYDLNPLANSQFSLLARGTAAPGRAGVPDTAEAAVGAAWRPFGRTGPQLALEHRFDLSGAGRTDAQLRISGVWASPAESPFDLSAYADAGIVGLEEGDLFAAAQAYGGYRLMDWFSAGGGSWAGWQRANGQSDALVEAGPALRLHVPVAQVGLVAEASYRFRLEGSGDSDGPALTVGLSY